MQDQLISFETAVLAQKKGLNFSTNKRVYNDNKEVCIVDYDLSSLTVDIPCITQSLLQKWLREKHDIVILIRRSFHISNGFLYSLEIWADEENFRFPTSMRGLTYEYVLEDGLKKALSMIKEEQCGMMLTLLN